MLATESWHCNHREREGEREGEQEKVREDGRREEGRGRESEK